MHPDNNFTPDEPLYLRLSPDGWVPEFAAQRKIPLNEVRFPDFSVNRGKYSEPEDVLHPSCRTMGSLPSGLQMYPSLFRTSKPGSSSSSGLSMYRNLTTTRTLKFGPMKAGSALPASQVEHFG